MGVRRKTTNKSIFAKTHILTALSSTATHLTEKILQNRKLVCTSVNGMLLFRKYNNSLSLSEKSNSSRSSVPRTWRIDPRAGIGNAIVSSVRRVSWCIRFHGIPIASVFRYFLLYYSASVVYGRYSLINFAEGDTEQITVAAIVMSHSSGR